MTLTNEFTTVLYGNFTYQIQCHAFQALVTTDEARPPRSAPRVVLLVS